MNCSTTNRQIHLTGADKRSTFLWQRMLAWDSIAPVSVLSAPYLQPKSSGPWFNIKMSSYQYRKSHCGDKTVVRSSYLHNGISYTGKMTSLYWTTRPWLTQSTNHVQTRTSLHRHVFLSSSFPRSVRWSIACAPYQVPSGSEHRECGCPRP